MSGSYSAGTLSPSSPYYGGFDNNSQFGIAGVLVNQEKPPGHAKHWTEITLSNAMSNLATTYAREHSPTSPAQYSPAKVESGRVYAPASELAFDTTEDLTGANGPKQTEQILTWVLLPLALVGAVLLGRRSGRRLLIVLVPVVVVAFNAALFYGSTRLRVAAEPSIDVLASIGTLWLGGRIVGGARLGRRKAGADPVPGSSEMLQRPAQLARSPLRTRLGA